MLANACSSDEEQTASVLPKTCPQGLARHSGDADFASFQRVFDCPGRAPRRGPPVQGGALLEPSRARFAGSFRAGGRLHRRALLDQEGLGDPQKWPLCRDLSPLPDSNRGPPPYHGGFALREGDRGTALATAFFLQLRRFVCQTHPSLPTALSLPEKPRTCPQNPSPRKARPSRLSTPSAKRLR